MKATDIQLEHRRFMQHLPRFPKRGACLRAAIVATLALSLNACLMKRGGYDVPEVPLPEQYRNSSPDETPSTPDTTMPVGKPASLSELGTDAAMVEWWRTFGSRELSELIDRGLANNPDMRIAALRVAQAKARADIAKASGVPNVTVPIGASVQAPNGAVGTVPAEGGGGGTQRSYSASARGTWRLDIWGEQSAINASAEMQLWQAAYERDNVQRNVVASLASTYVEYLSLNDRLLVARDTEKVLSDILSTIEKRLLAEDATLMELEQQRSAIFAVRATIPALEQQREDAINSIAFLVGTVPGGLNLSDQGLDSMTSPFVIPGLPSALLLRRPDVRIVEARLLAADADIDAARARALPSLDLSAQAGYSSLFLGRLFQPQTLFWNLLASLSASIFDGGKRSSEKELSKVVQEEMVESYVRTIYQAMREVEGSLSTIRTSTKRLDAQAEATSAARRAWDISTEVYAAGGVDFLTMLDSQRTYHRSLDEYQRARMEQYRGYVTLFQSLGGGVKPGKPLPGKGLRPLLARSATAGATAPPKNTKVFISEGLDWSSTPKSDSDGMGWQVEEFWQVELAGLYPRTTIGAAWRDLRTRYPKLMETRVLRPRQIGQIEEGNDPEVSWYRLYVAKFNSIAAAHDFCGELLANQQRCRVISSRSDDTVPPPPGFVRPKSQISARVEDLTAPTTAAKVTVEPPLPKAEPAVAKVETPKAAAQEEVSVKSESVPTARVLEVVRGGKKQAYKAPVQSKAVQTGVAKPAEKPAEKIAEKPVEKLAEKAPAKLLEKPVQKPQEKPAFAVQLGAFSTSDNAEKSVALWQFKGYDVYLVEYQGVGAKTWYSVRTGEFVKRRDAIDLAATVGRKEDITATVVPILDGQRPAKAAEPAKEAMAPVSVSAPATISDVQAAPQKPAPATVAAKPAAKAKAAAKPLFAVQLGAFASLKSAADVVALWQGKGYEAYVSEIKDAAGRSLYGVRTGAFAARRDAQAMVKQLEQKEETKGLLVPAVLDASGKLATVDLSQVAGGAN